VELSIQGEVVGLGSGRSKKEAEQQAAKQALRQVGS
jgi:dsRNA-specific ribonuclease